eukprot:4134224-Amphidinium_carterae.1
MEGGQHRDGAEVSTSRWEPDPRQTRNQQEVSNTIATRMIALEHTSRGCSCVYEVNYPASNAFFSCISLKKRCMSLALSCKLPQPEKIAFTKHSN